MQYFLVQFILTLFISILLTLLTGYLIQFSLNSKNQKEQSLVVAYSLLYGITIPPLFIFLIDEVFNLKFNNYITILTLYLVIILICAISIKIRNLTYNAKVK